MYCASCTCWGRVHPVRPRCAPPSTATTGSCRTKSAPIWSAITDADSTRRTGFRDFGAALPATKQLAAGPINDNFLVLTYGATLEAALPDHALEGPGPGQHPGDPRRLHGRGLLRSALQWRLLR